MAKRQRPRGAGTLFKRNGRGPWLASWYDHTGRRKERSTRTTDKAAAERILAKYVADTALRREGVIDVTAARYAETNRKPLAEHLADWHAVLSANNTPEYAAQKCSRARRIIEGCKFDAWGDVSASRVQTFVADLGKPTARNQKHKPGLGVQARNQCLDAAKAFAKWMVQDGRAAETPLAHLKGGNPEKDRRRVRRAYTDDELIRLLLAAEAGPELYGIPGWVRAILYRLVAEAGLRQKEIRTLAVQAVNLDGDSPSVTVRAAYAKGGREDELPILPSMAEKMRRRVEAIGHGAAVFPLPTDRKQVIRMLKKDLAAAGIEYQDADGRYADFHALRHELGPRRDGPEGGDGSGPAHGHQLDDGAIHAHPGCRSRPGS